MHVEVSSSSGVPMSLCPHVAPEAKCKCMNPTPNHVRCLQPHTSYARPSWAAATCPRPAVACCQPPAVGRLGRFCPSPRPMSAVAAGAASSGWSCSLPRPLMRHPLGRLRHFVPAEQVRWIRRWCYEPFDAVARIASSVAGNSRWGAPAMP